MGLAHFTSLPMGSAIPAQVVTFPWGSFTAPFL